MANLDAASFRGSLPRKRSLFSHVLEELGGRIVRGDFGAEAALPNEAELGRELGASRSVIREAVKSLAAKGLIESRTRTGIRVLPAVRWNLLDPEVLGWRYSSMKPAAFFREIFEVRAMIEPQAARLAAERATKAEIEEMAAAFAAMEAAEVPGQVAINADLRFHRAVLAGAHNELLLQMSTVIGVGLKVSYRMSSETFLIFLPRHRQVLEAIAARRPEAARDAMAELLSETQRYLGMHPVRAKRQRKTETA
jgi:GntR family galactonate operon transcriptional repressor